MNELIPIIKEAFENHQDVSIKVNGTSMSPFLIHNETEVVISPFSGDLRRKDVYLYSIKNTYLLHRFIKQKNEFCLFRGDALYGFEKINKDKIYGIVREVKYKNKTISTNSKFYRFRVSLFLFKKSIKLLIRRIIKGKK